MRRYAYIYICAYLLLVVVSFVLPLFNGAGTQLIENNLSSLGAQQMQGNWIMNTTFGFMCLATLIYGSYTLKDQWVQLVVLYFFGVSLGMMAVYQAAGSNALVQYNHTSDALHFLFSELAGFGFLLLCISIYFKIRVPLYKMQTAAVIGIVIILSILQYQLPQYQGISQRILILISFGWLFYALTSYRSDFKKSPYINSKNLYKTVKNSIPPDEE
ncbi:uncharacterized protein DUF998 [Ulvibacter sp. MAR_2010_11]|uniref:DUF998 domain-containing protein n=1 Tax=Ulvibacter sp. MAR_2010_11 TaxID=1250229 RepID=UPI000C2C6C60|nr:DUF998 domain-containing protein [Ulvibacter sp. MAR_2010_11]PKA84498.1 uncharacterized protein DUF998 [Ulvibacter sp. MAR_2010_11]